MSGLDFCKIIYRNVNIILISHSKNEIKPKQIIRFRKFILFLEIYFVTSFLLLIFLALKIRIAVVKTSEESNVNIA